MRDLETIDSELRWVAALRRAARERGGPLPSILVADALLDETPQADRTSPPDQMPGLLLTGFLIGPPAGVRVNGSQFGFSCAWCWSQD
jgi:hypothetical protein